jgi:hypothetical protein
MLLVYRRRRTRLAAGRTETIPPSAPELTVTNTPSLSKEFFVGDSGSPDF